MKHVETQDKHELGLLPPGFLLVMAEFVDFGFDVKELNALHTAVDQAGDTIKKSEAPNVFVEEERQRRAGHSQEMSLQPPPALRLSSPERRPNLLIIFSAVGIKPDTRFPIRVFVMLLNITRQ